MEAQPLPQKLYNRCKELAVNKIEIEFSGGSDEGYLHVILTPDHSENKSLELDIEDWAWKTYEYNGAGDGSSYGDNYIYNLDTMKMQHQQWYHVFQKEDFNKVDLELDKND